MKNIKKELQIYAVWHNEDIDLHCSCDADIGISDLDTIKGKQYAIVECKNCNQRYRIYPIRIRYAHDSDYEEQQTQGWTRGYEDETLKERQERWNKFYAESNKSL